MGIQAFVKCNNSQRSRMQRFNLDVLLYDYGKLQNDGGTQTPKKGKISL